MVEASMAHSKLAQDRILRQMTLRAVGKVAAVAVLYPELAATPVDNRHIASFDLGEKKGKLPPSETIERSTIGNNFH
jgi:hypothetical protein